MTDSITQLVRAENPKQPIDPEDDFWQDEEEFVPCDKCDGHPACEDFGCAILAGLGRMVRKNIEPGNDDW